MLALKHHSGNLSSIVTFVVTELMNNKSKNEISGHGCTMTGHRSQTSISLIQPGSYLKGKKLPTHTVKDPRS